MSPELVVLLLLLVVGASAVLSARLQVAAPLLLVALGAGAAALPGVPTVEVPPELVLSGILPLAALRGGGIAAGDGLPA